ncbi:MAG: TonB-dependent receptor plug domain-containing protein [Rhodospirillaceae bacterium]
MTLLVPAAPRRMAGFRPAALSILLSSTAFVSPEVALAQSQPAAANVEEIVVTGTRVIRDGYEAPTPLTVLSVDQIEDSAPANISEFVMTLPQLVGNTQPQTARGSTTAGGVGLNTPQARNLGSARTLILLDGQRTVGSQPTGQVDVNTFPQQLVQRVEVVTGGASAAYGSDALAGVINFVLDRNFTGIKGEVQAGISDYGDGATYNASLSTGTPFAGGRGHFLLSGEYAKIEIIDGAPRRGWAAEGWNIITNPLYGTGPGQTTSVPERLVTPNSALTTMTRGGIITNTALRGIAFGPGGTPYNFQYGPLVRDPWMIGGEWKANDITNDGATLLPGENRKNLFTRLSYDLSDNVEVFAQYGWAYADAESTNSRHFASGDMVINVDNAFLAPEIRARAQSLNITRFNMGSRWVDLPYKITQIVNRHVRRYVVGANGNFDAVETSWTWDAYYQLGESKVRKSFYDRWRSTFPLALDSVRDAQGAAVCRINADANPNNNDPSCVPWNPFGIGVNTMAAANYVAGWSYALERNTQEVFAASATGEPFDLWAGPVSIAFGAEHRTEKVGGIEGPRNAINDSSVGNSRPTQGKYSVTEGFIETVVPLAANEAWAQSLEFNGAVRATDYSTSGYVTTWKLGATWSPVDDIRLRVTQSRDIRAPHNVELFAAGIFVGNLVNNPFAGGAPTNIQSETSGNPNLKPEKADTTGIGVVFQPSFLSGFSASVDYFNIKIKDVIGTVGRQDVPDRCFAGEQIFCSQLVFDANGNLTVVKIQPTNFIRQVNRGMDFEASYSMPFDNLISGMSGNLNLRGLATRYIKQLEDTGSGAGIINTVGQGGVRKWKYTFSATFDFDPLRATLIARGASAGVYNVTNIECTSGCPVSTNINRTQNINRLPAPFYLDLSLRYGFWQGDAGNAEAFFNVRNLLNTDPAIEAAGPGGSGSGIACNASHHDCLGRVFRAGIRFEM